MDITIDSGSLPHTDAAAAWPATATPSASRSATTSARAGFAGSRSAIRTSPARPSSCIDRPPTQASPSNKRRVIAETMANGATPSARCLPRDLNETFATLESSATEVVREPIEQPHGVRDCGFRDPAGNLIRINKLR